MRRATALAAAAAAAISGGGCGDSGSPADESANRSRTGGVAERGTRLPARPGVEPAGCPLELANCESASGRIAYVERVDPDGDGDAHFVLLSEESITAPGITVVDVGADLRPDPLPSPGDELSAAGPVFKGSYGQRQIQAEVVKVAR